MNRPTALQILRGGGAGSHEARLRLRRPDLYRLLLQVRAGRTPMQQPVQPRADDDLAAQVYEAERARQRALPDRRHYDVFGMKDRATLADMLDTEARYEAEMTYLGRF